MALWENYDKLRPESTPREERAWVRWQTRSVFYRMQRQHHVETQPLTDRMAATLVDEDSRQAKEDLEELMATLSPDEQRMVRLQMEGYQANEIASIMGLKRNAVYQRMHRIVVKARRAIVVVLLLIGTSAMAIAVVPQWRHTVFGSAKSEGAPQEEAPRSVVPRPTPRMVPQPQPSDDTIVELLPWSPPEPVHYLEASSMPLDTGQPPMPKAHRSQPVVIMSAHRLIVSGAEGEPVRIYDNNSGKLVHTQRCDGLCYFNLSRGDYFIQIGDDPALRYRVSL